MRGGPAGDQERDAAPAIHHTPVGFSDRFALVFTRLLRWCADTFFAQRYGHRAIVLETVAAVPGMVGATLMQRTAHRVVGYFEEEAALSYTLYLAELDAGRCADEAHHRDINHHFASKLAGQTPAAGRFAPYPQHAPDRQELSQ
jgi:Alternative oxidase